MNGDANDLKAALAGNEEAFARLYDRHAPIVLSLCRRQTWSWEEAEDAILETFPPGVQPVAQSRVPREVRDVDV